MNGQVTVLLPARRQGRRGRTVGADVAPGTPDPVTTPTPDRIPRVARVLALAHHWHSLIRSGAVRNQADIARLVGVSRARVTQVMLLLCLAPHIQEWLLLDSVGEMEGTETQRDLERAAREPLWVNQRPTRGDLYVQRSAPVR